MRIARGETFDGVRMSRIKLALRKTLGPRGAGTPALGVELGMVEPRLSAFLLKLSEAGYIEHAGTDGFVDRWRVHRTGSRLLASRIQPPIGRARADELLDAVVAAARAVNAGESAWVFRRLMVFGSYLTDDPELGDLDVAYELARRPDPPGRDLMAEARAGRATSGAATSPRDRPEEEVKRAVARISPHVSLHRFDDVEAIGAPYRTLLAYDPAHGIEEPVSGVVERPDPEGRDREEAARPGPVRSKACLDPAPPPLPAEEAPGRPRHLGGRRVPETPVTEGDLTVQHMWANGADLPDVMAAAREVPGARPQTERTLTRLIAALYARADDPGAPEIPRGVTPLRDIGPELLVLPSGPEDAEVEGFWDPAAGIERDADGAPVAHVDEIEIGVDPSWARAGRPSEIADLRTLIAGAVQDRLAGMCVDLTIQAPSGPDDDWRIELDFVEENGVDLRARVERTGRSSRRAGPDLVEGADWDACAEVVEFYRALARWVDDLHAALDRVAFHARFRLEPEDLEAAPAAIDAGPLATADLRARSAEAVRDAAFWASVRAEEVALVQWSIPGERRPSPGDLSVSLRAAVPGRNHSAARRSVPGGGPVTRLARLAREWRARNAGFLGVVETIEIDVRLSDVAGASR